MKNIWIELAQEKNHISQVNIWLEEAVNSDELPYALYGLFNCIYSYYGSDIVLKVDEDDATQDCVVEMLDFLEDDDPESRIFDLFTSLFVLVRGKLARLSVGFNTGDQDKNKILKHYHKKLKEDKKLLNG